MPETCIRLETSTFGDCLTKNFNFYISKKIFTLKVLQSRQSLPKVYSKCKKILNNINTFFNCCSLLVALFDKIEFFARKE